MQNPKKHMFQDQNTQFLKHFCTSDNLQDNTLELLNGQQVTLPNHQIKQPLQHQLQNQPISSSSENNAETKQFQQLTKSKQLRVLNGLFTRSRKFSQENINVKLKKNDDEISLNAKSEASLEIEQTSHQDDHVEKSDKSIGARSYKYQIQQIQSSFMKKIRNLELRIKNIDLNYETLLSKLKRQKQSTDKQNNSIKTYLQKHHPEIMKQINNHLKELEDSQFDSSSSSSSDKINDEWTPIMSKIQEIKFDGQKMCEKIKVCQEMLKKKQVQEEEIAKPLQLTSSVNEQVLIRQKLLRKYSIPSEIIKEKKQHFHIIRKKTIDQLDSSQKLGTSTKNTWDNFQIDLK